MPEAGKALGAEVVLETINANDLQPRITAAIQSGGGADLFMLSYNWPHLYQNAVVDVSDVATASAKDEGGFYEVFKPSFQVGGKWLGMPHSIVGNAIAYRKSWFKEVGFNELPEDLGRPAQGRHRAQEEGQALRPDPRPHLRRRARPGPIRCSGPSAAPRPTRPARRSRINSKGAIDSVKFMQRALEGGLRRGRAGLGRHEQQPRLPRGRDLRDAQRRLDLHRGQAPEGQDQGRARASRCISTSTTRSTRWPGPWGSSPCTSANGHGLMKYSKNPKLAKDFLRWLHKPENFDKWFQVCDGYSVGRHHALGEERHVGADRQAAADVPDRRAQHAHLRLRRPVLGQGHRGVLEVHRRGHVRQGASRA